MSETARWYVIHTYSGYENKVAQSIEKVVENQNFEELIHEIRVPIEKAIEINEKGQKKEVERKLFPGYVLVKMILSDDSWYVIRNIRGVTGFVGSTTKPIPLTESEVKALGVETVQIEVNYQVGDSVSIIAGSLNGFVGVVDSIDLEQNKVTVTVPMFGREKPVDVELNEVKLVD